MKAGLLRQVSSRTREEPSWLSQEEDLSASDSDLDAEPLYDNSDDQEYGPLGKFKLSRRRRSGIVKTKRLTKKKMYEELH